MPVRASVLYPSRIDFRYLNGFSRGARHFLIAPIWRPLPAVVAVQAPVAPILGVPALKLVPAT
jgi:hypothetical protein